MTIWSAEIKELETLYISLKGRFPELEKELEQLIKTEDANVALLYSRRCLEVIITDLCECELKRPRKTEPLKGIIDKLNHEEKVPSHIIASMLNLNSLSTFGAHPKEFDPRQVKPVLNNLLTILEWYLKYKSIEVDVSTRVVEVKETAKSPDPSLPKQAGIIRKRYSAIFGTLLVICIVLLLVFDVFDFFSKDKFKEIRDPDGKISIAVMPFQNLTGDSSLNFWQSGISEFLINDLGTSEELSILSSRVISEVLESNGQMKTLSVSPSVARDVAQKIRAGTHITGNFMGSGDDVSILVNLVNTENGEVMWSNRIDGALKSGEYRHLLDSLSDQVRNFLEIKALEQQANEDFLNAYPNSAEAYRYYIDGLKLIVATDYESAIESLQKSIEIDSNFTFAAFYLAWAYWYSSQLEKGYFWTKKTYDTKHYLPSKYHHWINLWYACIISKNRDDIAKYLRLLEEAGINSRFFWFDLGITYEDFLEDYNNAITAFEKVMELSQEWGGYWEYDRYYTEYSWVLLQARQHDKGKEIRKIGLQINPDNGWLLVHQAISDLIVGDTLAAEMDINEIKSLLTRLKYSESILEMAMGRIYYNTKDTLKAEEHYRKAYNLDPENPNRIWDLADVLIRYEVNIEEGMAITQKMLDQNPYSTGFLRLKALALHKLGRHQEALQILKELEKRTISYFYPIHNEIREVEQALAKTNQ